MGERVLRRAQGGRVKDTVGRDVCFTMSVTGEPSSSPTGSNASAGHIPDVESCSSRTGRRGRGAARPTSRSSPRGEPVRGSSRWPRCRTTPRGLSPIRAQLVVQDRSRHRRVASSGKAADRRRFFGTIQGGAPTPSLQGGCLGGTRDAALCLLASRALRSPQLADPQASWARGNPNLAARVDAGLVSFDFVHGWACRAATIPLRNPEIRSEWRHPRSPGVGHSRIRTSCSTRTPNSTSKTRGARWRGGLSGSWRTAFRHTPTLESSAKAMTT